MVDKVAAIAPTIKSRAKQVNVNNGMACASLVDASIIANFFAYVKEYFVIRKGAVIRPGYIARERAPPYVLLCKFSFLLQALLYHT